MALLKKTTGLTATQFAGWFPDGVYERLSRQDFEKLLKKINHVAAVRKRRTETSIKAADDKETRLLGAIKIARSLKSELGALVRLHDLEEIIIDLQDHTGKIIPSKADEQRDLLKALNHFLDLNPGRKTGAPAKWWHELAERWAGDVRVVLPSHRGRPTSLTSDSGPVLAVVSKILKYCYNIECDKQTIGSALRGRKARRKSSPISA